MHLGLLLDMTDAALGDRPAVTVSHRNLDHHSLASLSWAATAHLRALGVPSVLYVGGNDLAFPIALFGAAGAGVPFIPLNYRLGEEQMRRCIGDHPGALVIFGGTPPPGSDPATAVDQHEFVTSLDPTDAEAPPPVDPNLPCVLLYTSGTTSAPKAAVLRHRHLMSYVLGTVELGAAEPDEASLVSVPTYHIAGVANLLTNVYSGRRIVYLDRFDPASWLETVRREEVTHAMVVPTMLSRLVSELGDATTAATPALRTMSYGGAPMPVSVLRRAMELFPTTGFVNAYGLTETSSTIALLDPDDHRDALASTDPDVRNRLGSVGRLLPGIELEVRNEAGQPLPEGQPGILYLRGEQVSGEYRTGSVLDADGWFPTRDRGWVDAKGYLFIEGRADDTIIRGGENIAPAEIEDVLLSDPAVVEAAVVGLPDQEWGQRLAAVVVADTGATVDVDRLRDEVRTALRSSKTPETIAVWPELPRTDTGKLLRREIVARLSAP